MFFSKIFLGKYSIGHIKYKMKRVSGVRALLEFSFAYDLWAGPGFRASGCRICRAWALRGLGVSGLGF